MNYQHLTARGDGPELFGYRTRYWSFLLKLAKDRPSWTLPASPGPGAGPATGTDGGLTVAERLALQGLPHDWPVHGATDSRVRLAGNATPPPLAEAVARALVEQGVIPRPEKYHLVRPYLRQDARIYQEQRLPPPYLHDSAARSALSSHTQDTVKALPPEADNRQSIQQCSNSIPDALWLSVRSDSLSRLGCQCGPFNALNCGKRTLPGGGRSPLDAVSQQGPWCSLCAINSSPGFTSGRAWAYVERRTAQGMSKKEIIRCLKRYNAREVYTALLTANDLELAY